jgi:hypothetical protein
MEELLFEIIAHDASGTEKRWETGTAPLGERALGILTASVFTAIALQRLKVFSDARVSVGPKTATK